MKYLFLDTNIFLHYQWFEDIPWERIVNDDYTVVVVPIVQDELDDKKDYAKERIQKRARKVSSSLFGFLMGQKECKVKIVRCKDPIPTQQDRERMDLSKNDYKIILSALQSGYDKKDIIIVSSDNNVLFHARDFGLGFILMDDVYRLPPEKTEIEKQKEELERELHEERDKRPQPYLTFKNSKKTISFQRFIQPNISAIIEEKMAEAKKEIPEKVLQEDSGVKSELANTLLQLQGAWYPRYNEDRKLYLEEQRAYLELKCEKDALENRFAQISFELHNSGKGPTGEEIIYLLFPDTLRLYSKKESLVSKTFVKPIKPSLGLASVSRDTMRLLSSSSAPFTPPNNVIWMWDPERPLEDKHAFKLRDNYLLQTDKKQLGLELYIDLANTETFDIKWAIVDENLSEPEKGILQVIIED